MRFAPYLVFAATLGCTGAIGELDVDPPREAAEGCCAAPPRSADAIRLFRLSPHQYARTIEDLLGVKPPSGPSHEAPFEDAAALGTISDADAAHHQEVAQKVAQEASLPSCEDEACARAFIVRFGKRAFRRPLGDDEVARFVGLWSLSQSKVPGKTAMAIVVETFLQSPSFLFRTELGDASATEGTTRLTPWEIASALSYTFWDTMPDDALLEAAERGDLATDDGVEAQAKRLVSDARARGPLLRFWNAILGYEGLATATRDPKLFPRFAEQASAMRRETETFIDDLVFARDGDLATLLTAPWSFVDASLAPLYGVSAPASGFVRVDFDKGQRAGVLTQLGFLTAHATPLASSPPRRGKVVAERFLCLEIAPPPANVPGLPATSDGGPKTTRQKFAEHTTNATCRACHSVLDPLGFSFERYDEVGRFRTSELGLAIDSKTTLSGLGDLDGPLEDAVSLAAKLAKSDTVKRCIVKQTFRFALGRRDAPADAPALDALVARFVASGGRLRDLWISVARSRAFVERRIVR